MKIFWKKRRAELLSAILKRTQLSEEYYLLTTELSSRAQLSTLNRHPERSVSTPNRHPERSEAESKDLKRQIMLVKDEDNIYLTLLVTTSRIIQYVRQETAGDIVKK